MNTLLLRLVLMLNSSSLSIYLVSAAPVPQVYGTLYETPTRPTTNSTRPSLNSMNINPYATNYTFAESTSNPNPSKFVAYPTNHSGFTTSGMNNGYNASASSSAYPAPVIHAETSTQNQRTQTNMVTHSSSQSNAVINGFAFGSGNSASSTAQSSSKSSSQTAVSSSTASTTVSKGDGGRSSQGSAGYFGGNGDDGLFDGNGYVQHVGPRLFTGSQSSSNNNPLTDSASTRPTTGWDWSQTTISSNSRTVKSVGNSTNTIETKQTTPGLAYGKAPNNINPPGLAVTGGIPGRISPTPYPVTNLSAIGDGPGASAYSAPPTFNNSPPLSTIPAVSSGGVVSKPYYSNPANYSNTQAGEVAAVARPGPNSYRPPKSLGEAWMEYDPSNNSNTQAGEVAAVARPDPNSYRPPKSLGEAWMVHDPSNNRTRI